MHTQYSINDSRTTGIKAEGTMETMTKMLVSNSRPGLITKKINRGMDWGGVLLKFKGD